MSEFITKEDNKDIYIKKLLKDVHEADQIIKNLDLKSIKQKERIRELENEIEEKNKINKEQEKTINDNIKIVEDFNNKFNNIYTKYCKYKKESKKLKEHNQELLNEIKSLKQNSFF